MEIYKKVINAASGLDPALKQMLLDSSESEARELLETLLSEEYNIFYNSLYDLLPSQQNEIIHIV